MAETQADRLKLIWDEEGLKVPWVAERTRSSESRWKNVRTGLVELRGSEIEDIGALFPEYRLWLAYGEEEPEFGQISPMTKKAQRQLKKTP
ncbi:MAG: hypothetical protein CMH97_03415 [Oceanospirillaceae bacterium]|jgi:hypothetical protein|nr:hypothetical protein [Oceanospirillaceae bacterium]